MKAKKWRVNYAGVSFSTLKGKRVKVHATSSNEGFITVWLPDRSEVLRPGKSIHFDCTGRERVVGERIAFDSVSVTVTD